MGRERLSEKHWLFEKYTERMHVKDWQGVLLDNAETIAFEGKIRHLKAKPLGYNVVEVYKEPLHA